MKTHFNVNELKCKKCLLDDAKSFDELNITVNDYIKAMDEDIVIDEEQYKARLDGCFECEGLTFGVTCKYCGCFVQIRALNKLRHCAYPKEDEKKW